MDEAERQQLVGAAWRVLERSGFEGFKVQLVLREAGVSARAFYRHFADKDELTLALLQDEMTRAASRTRDTLAALDDPVDQVIAWIRSVLGAATDPRRVSRTRLFAAQQPLVRRFAAEVGESVRLLHQPLIDALAQGVATGIFPWAQPDRDSALIAALVQGRLVATLTDSSDPDLPTLVADTATFVLRALGTPTNPTL